MISRCSIRRNLASCLRRESTLTAGPAIALEPGDIRQGVSHGRARSCPGVSVAESGTRRGRSGLGSALAVLCTAQFVDVMGVTVVVVALPTMRADLDATASQVQLVVSVYAFLFGCLLLAGGRAADRWGRLRLFRGGLAGFGAASLVCAVAPSAEVLIAGPGRAGRLGGGDRPGRARARHRDVHRRRRTPPRARRLDGGRRRRRGPGPVRRRRHHRPRRLALDLRRERAARALLAAPRRPVPAAGRARRAAAGPARAARRPDAAARRRVRGRVRQHRDDELGRHARDPAGAGRRRPEPRRAPGCCCSRSASRSSPAPRSAHDCWARSARARPPSASPRSPRASAAARSPSGSPAPPPSRCSASASPSAAPVWAWRRSPRRRWARPECRPRTSGPRRA